MKSTLVMWVQPYLISFVLFIPVILSQSNSNLELQLVQVLFRHGDRNPLDSYPTDPFKNESFWSEGFGQLTKRGKQQQYGLGKFLRKRYNGFLSQRYSPNEIYVKSTDMDRTLMSAEANLAGLYPPEDPVSLWNPSIQWQPIPVHTESSDNDKSLRMSAPCPKLDRITEDFEKSPYMGQLYAENKDLFEYLSNNTGAEITNLETVEGIYDTLLIESLYNFTLPKWTKKVFPAKLLNLTSVRYKVRSLTHEMQRLRVGPLLQDIIQNMRNKENGTESRKMFMYSAHDSTVANLLNTLGVFNDLPPPYASAVIMELWKNTSSQEYFFKVNFRNDTESGSEPFALTIPGCNARLCPLETFARLVSSKIPADWDWEAECRDGFFGLEGFSLTVLILAILLSAISLLSILAVVIVCCKRKKESYSYLGK